MMTKSLKWYSNLSKSATKPITWYRGLEIMIINVVQQHKTLKHLQSNKLKCPKKISNELLAIINQSKLKSSINHCSGIVAAIYKLEILAKTIDLMMWYNLLSNMN
jgi:hypothetical protein